MCPSYALDAFRVNSIDYLLKPIKPEDLRRALDKFRQRTPVDLMQYLSRLNALSEKPRYSGRLLVQDRDRILPVAVSDPNPYISAKTKLRSSRNG